MTMSTKGRWRGVLAALFVAAACGREAPPVRTGAGHAIDLSAVRIGMEEGDSAAAIGTVLAARFTASGRNVVVLDFAPPFVKVFQDDGTLVSAFLSRGSGPLEMRAPSALAVAGDSLILVADGSRRVAVFGMDGRLRGEGRTPFPLLAAVPGCEPGEWLAYGPRFEAGSRPTWLHRLRVEPGGARVTELDFRDGLAEGTIGNGLAYGITRDSAGVVVWHVLGSTPGVVGWRCRSGMVGVWPVRPLAERRSAEGGGDAVRMAVRPGDRSLAGMAAVRDGVVLAARVVPRPGEAAVTEYTLVTHDGERTVAVPGAFTLRDVHPTRGVLVSATDPVPHLFTVPAETLRALFDRND